MMEYQTILIRENLSLVVCTKLKQLEKEVKKLPLSLGQALDRLAEDEVIKSAMPDEMYKVFHWYKNDEWERFLGATTQWDLDTYLDCLP
jgi:glutamine synthetase